MEEYNSEHIHLKNDSKELVLVLEVDTSHAESLLSSFTDWEDVKLEKDLVRKRQIHCRKKIISN